MTLRDSRAGSRTGAAGHDLYLRLIGTDLVKRQMTYTFDDFGRNTSQGPE
jgi:hypothetical protein